MPELCACHLYYKLHAAAAALCWATLALPPPEDILDAILPALFNWHTWDDILKGLEAVDELRHNCMTLGVQLDELVESCGPLELLEAFDGCRVSSKPFQKLWKESWAHLLCRQIICNVKPLFPILLSPNLPW